MSKRQLCGTVLSHFCSEMFRESIFTRLDETTSTAAVFSEAARTRRPVSFLCNGQSVPEDIRPASKDSIISSLVRQLPESLQAVA